MVRVRRVCASLLILFAFESLSVYRSLTAVGILHIRAVSHQSVTYGSFSWRNQFVLSQSQGQLQQAFRCMCTSVRKGLGAERPGCHGGAFIQGLIISFLVCPVQAEMFDPRVWVGCADPGDFQRQELNWCSAPGESPTVSQILPNLTFTATHTIQVLRKETVAWQSSGEKQIQLQVPQTRSKDDVVLSCTSAQTAEPSRPRFSSTQLLNNCPHPFLPASSPLLLGQKWSFALLLNLITSLALSERARKRAAPTVLACSILYYWCIISRMPSSFIKHFWSNVNRLENWDIYEVWAVFMKKSIKYDRGEVR